MSEKEHSSYKYQKIVSPDDFAFALWKKPTYYILNMKQMRVDLIPLWDHIGHLIRKAALKVNKIILLLNIRRDHLLKK